MNIIRSIRSLLFILVMLATVTASFAQIRVSIRIGPPPLPVYVQPPCPAEGYLWVPGYWAYDYDDSDYYWVPGTWVLAPEPGLLWTPGYWAWSEERFIFHEGYWGPRVGFYGGVVYGYGYFGRGYEGGRWDNGRFFYNRAVNNVNVTTIHNVYNTTVINDTTVNRVSYNGGNGGIEARPTTQEEAAAQERHIQPAAAQTQQAQAARADRQLRASVNQGKPPVAATPKPGAFNDSEAVPAKEAGGPYNSAVNRAAAQPEANAPTPRPDPNRPNNDNGVARSNNNATRPKDVPPPDRPAAPSTGNSKADQKYQQQQQKLVAKQEQERQQLQQKQDKQRQQLTQQKADEARMQKLEQQHQQQTQQLEQKHEQQQQKLQGKHPPANQPSANQNQSKPPKAKEGGPPTDQF